MIITVDTYWKEELLKGILLPDGYEIPFVRFNSSEHAKLSESDTGKPYGCLQALSPEPDHARDRPHARIWKHVDVDKKIARVDVYPEAVKLIYQVSVYVSDNGATLAERNLAQARLACSRRLRNAFHKTLSVDIFGDGQEVDKLVHFVKTNSNYQNPLDQPRNFQVDWVYSVEAWIFHHTPQDRATFWNEAQVEIGAFTVQDQQDLDNQASTPSVVDNLSKGVP